MHINTTIVLSKLLPYKKAPQWAYNHDASNLFLKLNNTRNMVKKYLETAPQAKNQMIHQSNLFYPIKINLQFRPTISFQSDLNIRPNQNPQFFIKRNLGLPLV